MNEEATLTPRRRRRGLIIVVAAILLWAGCLVTIETHHRAEAPPAAPETSDAAALHLLAESELPFSPPRDANRGQDPGGHK